MGSAPSDTSWSNTSASPCALLQALDIQVGLGQETHLLLVAQRENANLIPRDDKAVERYVAGLSVGNDQLPDLALNTAPNERVRGEVFNSRLNGNHGSGSRTGILVAEELEDPLDVLQGSSGINYRCHGFGFAAASTLARRPIQA